MDPARRLCQLLTSLWLTAACSVWAQTLPEFDFTTAAGVQGWSPTHDISQLTASPTGLVVRISGSDPYLTGPARDYPSNQPLWLRLRLISDVGGSCQVFYFNTYATEAASARFNVPTGRLVEGRVAIPALGSGFRIRIDPPGTSGQATLVSLRFEACGSLPDFDFGTVPDGTEWGSPHDVIIGTNTLSGLPVTLTGTDPYFSGPPRDYPPDLPLWMNIRLKSPNAGNGQVFYFQTGPTEANSAHFSVSAGDWTTVRVPLPALWTATRLRLDPPGSTGVFELGRITFDPRPPVPEPAWPQPGLPVLGSTPLEIGSGELTLEHGQRLGAFELRVNGNLMAVGNSRLLAGYFSGSTLRWLELTNPASVTLDTSGELRVVTGLNDPDGAHWQIEQKFRPSPTNGIALETRVTIDQDRSIVSLPMAMLLPGVGSFGTNKSQAILAGVEYLENEPSSSEADVYGAGALRKVPYSYKLTMPLMALSASNVWVGLSWTASSQFAALHDSPDRIFNSGGHVMGVVYPGADTNTRQDGSVLPYGGSTLVAGEALMLRATIFGGTGQTVVPAIQEHVSRQAIPALPSSGYTAQTYYDLASRGWLYSEIRDGYKFRHAVGSGFTSAAVADAPMYMDWLSANVADANIAGELTQVASNALALVAPPNYNSAAVGHVQFPAPALVYRAAAANAAMALTQGNNRLPIFAADGSVQYVPPSGGLDLSATHWSKEANGLTATHVLYVLEKGVFSGNPTLIAEGLRLLRALDKFRDTVPRGAQTWEVPLHTPDILASAYLVRAYTIGYEITGEPDMLDQARYWAWTGVPFVYLRDPTDSGGGASNRVGRYATIPVLGATHYVAPLWIGLPVQWCGLVYGNAIRRFAPHDPQGPWVQLADGIALSGMQQTHPPADAAYIGLLPDSFDLLGQFRNPVPINPATLLPEAIGSFGSGPVYEFHSLPHHGLLLHAPGAVTELRETPDRVEFHVAGWPRRPWQILVNGFSAMPRVYSNGIPWTLSSPNTYETANGRLTLQLDRPADITIMHAALDDLRCEFAQGTAVLKLTWPVGATNYVLQSSNALSPTAAWQDSPGPFSIDGSRRVYLHTLQEAQIYFRLRRQ